MKSHHKNITSGGTMKISICTILCSCLLVLGIGSAQAAGHHHPGHGSGETQPVSDMTICQSIPDGAELCMSLEWQQGPVVGGESQFKLHLMEKEGASLSGDQIPEVVLWMPHHGHGSSPVQMAEAVDKDGLVMPGHYEVTEAYFVMPGLWEIRIKTLLAGQEYNFTFAVEL